MGKHALNIILLLSLAFFSALMIRLSLPYLGDRYDVDFLRTKQNIIHVKVWRYAFYIHVFLSVFALIAGFTQFSKRLLEKKKSVHRLMGYIYVTDIILFAGPSALIMGFYANGTLYSRASFVVLALLWLFTTAVALSAAKQKKFVVHRNWMIRSYALTLSAITLRLLAYFLPFVIRLDANFEYTLIAWLSWIINAILAELIIRFKSSGYLTH